MNLESILGLGPKNIRLLCKLNVNTVEDLLTFYPFRYEILERSIIEQLEEGDQIIVDGIITVAPLLFRFKGNMNKMSFQIQANDRLLKIVVYNRGFMKQHLQIGKWVTVTGKYSKKKNLVTASTLELGNLESKPTIRGVYHTVNGLTNKMIKKYIDIALENYLDQIEEQVPEFLNERYHFLDKKSALYNIHNPSDMALLKQSLIKLKYEELFIFMLKIQHLKQKHEKDTTHIQRMIDFNRVEAFINSLPFALTSDQQSAVYNILADFKQGKRMNRLLQGDVGSGKTIVAMIAMYMNYLSGYQSAMMAPTEILAHQHFDNMKKLLPNLKIELLLGSTLKSKKKKIIEDLAQHNIDVIIGTHALIQEDINYKCLGLVITDEQHRFGVNQRSTLKNKGDMPDVLYMSATPIPRTYALTIYGDMDVSNIKTMPNGRKKVETFLKNNLEMKEVLQMMYEELKKGHQIFVVAPLIVDSEKSNLENVVALQEKMKHAFGKYFQVELLHGKMKNQEKEIIMERFKKNESHILISTTVIEVGVDIPNATMILIFNAERFGLSTLHQLRGRVGRNDLPCKCILISDYEKERLKIMTEIYDGFEISEADFKLRGHGDLFGMKQSGDMAFKIADIRNDFKILVQAKKDAQEFLQHGKMDPKYQALFQELSQVKNLD